MVKSQNGLKEKTYNNNNMILNKKTGRYNNLQTALKNGLITDSDNFILPKNTLLLNSTDGYYLRKYTPAYKKKSNEFLVNVNEYIVNPKTNRYLLKTDKNIEKINKYNEEREQKERAQLRNEKILYKETFKKHNTRIYNVEKWAPEILPEGMDIIEAKVQGLIKEKPSVYSRLHYIFKKYIGKSITAVYIIDGNIIMQYNYDIPHNFSSWWKRIMNDHHWMVNSDLFIFAYNNFEGKFYIYEQNEIINTEKIGQYFRYGVSNCLLTPIKDWCVKRLDEIERRHTRYKYEKKLNIINELLIKYKNGVPEDKISEICDILQIDINIDLPFRENCYITCHSNKKALQKFSYINTRLNHVDYITNEEIETVNSETLNELVRLLDEKNEFYTFNKNSEGITSIRTIDKQYILYNDFIESVNNFEQETGLLYCKIDDINDYKLSQFVRAGCHYNSCVDFIDIYKYDNAYYLVENVNDYKHIDMKKAYASYRMCNFYSGFLGKITDFRETDKIEGVGLYQIYDLNFSKADKKFLMYCEKLKIYNNDMIYPSPELELLKYYGVDFKIKGGCWGVETFEFDFNFDMLCKKNKNGSSYYALYAGLCNRDGTIKSFNIKGDYNYAEMLKYNSKNTKVLYDNDNKNIRVEYKKKYSSHLSHITAFLTCYARLTMIQQLLEMDYNNIARISSDGIYFKEHDFKLIEPFRYKSGCEKFHNNAAYSYISGEKYKCEFNKKRDHYKSIICLGEGGCGKTHNNITDDGLCKKIYVAPTWKLATAKKNEYNINATVWARLITQDVSVRHNIKKYYNVLIIDECSMMNNKQKNFILTNYSNMKIIFCGDLFYQLGPIDNKCMDIKNIEYIDRNNDVSKRYKCDKLVKLSNYIRESIRDGIRLNKVKQEVKEILDKEGQYIKELDYNINDIIISHSNKKKDYYTGLYKGKFEEEKYYITQTTREYQNGLIIISKDIPKVNNEVRHGFTSYSIQGETFYNKIFIDIEDLINLQSLYTCISRAQYLSQIYIIH